MIIGIGHDVCDATRIEITLERFGDRFTHRAFTALEREKCDRRAKRADSYARRFAAKEACSKALGTGFRRGVHLATIGVVNLPGGKPTLELTDGALDRLREITPDGTVAKIDVSLTDDRGLAYAIVLITAVPEASAAD
ncbi:MAG: holo-ACP synthase [Alphaproteobacteria bacterium]|jgi:holo-[acyl-carrier protein] synthase